MTRIRKEARLPFDHPNYQHPTHKDVRYLKEETGKTAAELAKMVGASEPRTIRRWMEDPGTTGSRPIPYAAWRLLLVMFRIQLGFERRNIES